MDVDYDNAGRMPRLVRPEADWVRFDTPCAGCAGKIEHASGARRLGEPPAFVV